MRRIRLAVGLISFVMCFQPVIFPSLNLAPAKILPQYDENTEIVLLGEVIHTDVDSELNLRYLEIQSAKRLYRVFLAPEWFIAKYHVPCLKGGIVEVVGSKFYCEDGVLAVLAKHIRYLPSGKTLVLRDAASRPIWRQGHDWGTCIRYLPKSQ